MYRHLGPMCAGNINLFSTCAFTVHYLPSQLRVCLWERESKCVCVWQRGRVCVLESQGVCSYCPQSAVPITTNRYEQKSRTHPQMRPTYPQKSPTSLQQSPIDPYQYVVPTCNGSIYDRCTPTDAITRGLRICKRALHICRRALHICKSAL